MRKFLLNAEVLVAHNQQRWDIPTLERILGIKIKAKLVDSLALSWYLFPEDEEGNTRRKHGLEEWGEEFGIPKPVINDWFNLSQEEYEHRCTEDVRINWRLWIMQWNKLLDLYTSEEEVWKFLDYLEFKMHCARLQEEVGWKLDKEYAEKSLIELLEEQQKKVDHLRKVMPKVPIIKKKNPPKRMYTKDGKPSKIGQSWLELIEKQNLPLDVPEVEYVDGYEEPNPGSPDQVKAWLFSLGWQPKTLKQVKDEKTGEKRDIPQVNKEKQKRKSDDDILCDSVKELFDKEPELQHLEGLGLLRHRIGILSGFLRDVDGKGLLRARISGLTNTLRFKHAEIVNLPKPDLPYASGLRASLTAPEGYELCGADMTSLEDRLKQHFIYPLDPKYVESMLRDDFDPHIELAVFAGMLTEKEAAAYKAGDKSKKPIRDIAKNGNYACQYGAYPPRLALTCGISLDKAKELFDGYWKMNWAIKAVSNSQTIKTLKNGEKWLQNPINKFWYSLRSENDVFSTLVQGTASYCFDLWVENTLNKREQLTAQFHDEMVLCIRKGFRQEAEHMLYEALDETNSKLRLNRQLDIGVQFGDRYSEIH